MSKTIGIDLGTTNSVAAVIGPDGRPRVVQADDQRIVPSAVALDHEGRLLVGRAARNYAPIDPASAVRSVKRSMGTDEVFTLGERSYGPQEVSALILRKMKSLAEADLGEEVRRAVITVPAYFSDAARQATKEAGELAGLEVVRIINEPTAAALAYSAGKDLSERVLVYDLGGGTFDVSVVQIEAGIVEVVATTGNNRLGGDDFDRRIVDHVGEYFLREHGVDVREDKRAMARLLLAAEEAKIILSQRPFAALQEEFIIEKDGMPLHLDFELSRERFEHLIEDLIQLTIDLVDEALEAADLEPSDLDQVLLVGGSTRIPMVRRRLEDHLGIEPAGYIHPDECVALGAAVQAGIIDGEDVDTILVDVTAHSLGIEVVERVSGIPVPGAYSVLIPRNTVIPTSRSELYTTVVDGQEAVRIRVFQGEAPVVEDNVFLGEFEITGLPKRARAGEPQIVVTFDYDRDGIVHVRAQERKSKRAGRIQITDARERMEEAERIRAEAAVAELWAERASEEDSAVPASTRRLISRAREVAAEAEEARRERLLALVAEIEGLFDGDELTEDEEDQLAELEDELLEELR